MASFQNALLYSFKAHTCIQCTSACFFLYMISLFLVYNDFYMYLLKEQMTQVSPT